ncbi:MAG: Lrp/AsnC family transcriptional regulator [Nitrososphaerota archaeon]|nr:Lrp/AsnC family transcriptional regulator [Nitrososphaerota archaeon]MDG7024774.1 Lrp/AsnC family transcriptional regulator [Nitrososphaerota archaeon]
MKSAGFLMPFLILVNPALLGVTMGALIVDIPPSAPKGRLLQELSLVDGMLLIVSLVGTTLGMVFWYEDEGSRRKKVELVSRVCSATAAEFASIPYPPCTVALSKLDWEIVEALQLGVGRFGCEVSEKLGISAKTLQTRVERMIEGRAVPRVISFDARRLRGAPGLT